MDNPIEREILVAKPAEKPERLPWVAPRFESIQFEDAKLNAGAGGDAGASTS
jgi:hypothetical protein